MITANEIRVGNRFIRELPTQRGQEFDHDFVLTEEWMGKLFGDSSLFALQDLFPIPLTPEVLYMVGVPDKDTHFGGWLISINEHGEAIRIVEGEEGYYWPFNGHQKVVTDYLHQLQNLYFALTNQELNYHP